MQHLTLKQRQQLIYLYSKAIFSTSNNELEQQTFLSEFIEKRFKHWDWFEVIERIKIFYNEIELEPEQQQRIFLSIIGKNKMTIKPEKERVIYTEENNFSPSDLMDMLDDFN